MREGLGDPVAAAADRATVEASRAADVVEKARRTRRHPRVGQPDYLHLKRLLADLRQAIEAAGPVSDILDVYCGSRPYDDLFPPLARRVGLDVVGNPYGVADVVTDEFLPFPDASFDLVTCIEAFQYIEDPRLGVDEIRRVLRPSGTAIVSVPFVWEYDRTILEHRYTGPELAALFEGWVDVRVVEDGGRAIAWATLTGSILESVKRRLPRAVRAAFPVLYLAVNGVGAVLDAAERRQGSGAMTLPMNLLLTARRPDDA